MSRLYFECRFKAYQLRSLDLPIEVRRPNLTLVTRCRSSQSVELMEGTYYLIARLPTDQELYSKVQLEKDTDLLAILTSDEENGFANGIQEILHFLGGLQDRVLQISQPESSNRVSSISTSRRAVNISTLLYSLRNSLFHFIDRKSDTKTINAKIRLFRGNVLQDNCTVVFNDEWLAPSTDDQAAEQHAARAKKVRWPNKSNKSTKEDSRVALFSISGVDSPQLIQLLQPNFPVINMMLPVSKFTKCSLILRQFPDDSCTIDIRLGNVEADLLLRYLQEGLLTQEIVVARSEQQTLETLKNLKWDDPIAAAVSAYALLCFNDLEHLHGWTEDFLSSRFAWLPDGIAIRGEYLARIGEHDQALSLFLELPARGLPVFSDGLSYIMGRLERYTRYGEDLFENDKLSQARDLLKRLQDIALFVDFHQSLLTFNGINPGKPENNLLNNDITSYDGCDVASFLLSTLSSRRSILAVIRELRLKKVIKFLISYFGGYRASLLGIGFIIPIIATLVTLICYITSYFLPPPLFLTAFERGWYTLLIGVFFTGMIWGVVPSLHAYFVSPEKANPRSYRALKDRLHELENRLGITALQKKSPTLEEKRRAARVGPEEKLTTLSALDEAYACYVGVREEIEKPASDLRWMLGTGYVKTWKTLHRAEEALMQFEPASQVIRNTIHTNVRIQNSCIGSRTPLLKLSRRAVKNMDSTAEFNKSVKSEETASRNTPFTEQHVGTRISSRNTQQVFNKYRDNLWQGLIGRRNVLLRLLLVTGIATYLLLCITILTSNPTAITEATSYYIVGFMAGVIGPLYRAIKKQSAIDDYGFTRIYVPVSCLISGLVAVFGLLVLGRLSLPNIFTEGPVVILLHVFRPDQFVNLLIALFFGLLANLYFVGLVQEVGKIEIDLLQKNATSASDFVLPISGTENDSEHLHELTASKLKVLLNYLFKLEPEAGSVMNSPKRSDSASNIGSRRATSGGTKKSQPS